LNRREKVIMNRLRIWHTKLTHGYLMAEQPRCTTCGIEPTIKHIFTECLQYLDELKNLNIPNTLEAVLGPDSHTINQVLVFLKNSNLYNSM
jgi:hypothetical protein